MKVYYTLEHRFGGLWVIFKNIEKDHSINFTGVFRGSKKECLKWAEQMKVKIKKN